METKRRIGRTVLIGASLDFSVFAQHIVTHEKPLQEKVEIIERDVHRTVGIKTVPPDGLFEYTINGKPVYGSSARNARRKAAKKTK